MTTAAATTHHEHVRAYVLDYVTAHPGVQARQVISNPDRTGSRKAVQSAIGHLVYRTNQLRKEFPEEAYSPGRGRARLWPARQEQ